MSHDRELRTAEILLEQIGEDPETIVELLPPTELDALIEGLGRLQVQADGVVSEEEMLDVCKGVLSLVSMSPVLRRAFLPNSATDSIQRQITLAAHKATAESCERVQRQAPQIRNRVLECRQKLEEAVGKVKDTEKTRER